MGIFGEINYHFEDNNNYNLKLNFLKVRQQQLKLPLQQHPQLQQQHLQAQF